MKKILAIGLASLSITGCVSVQQLPVSADAQKTLVGKTGTYSVYKKPDFAAMTPGKAAFAMIGAVAMISEGNKIIETNKVADPAAKIGEDLLKGLEERHKVVRLKQESAQLDTDDLDQLVKLHPQADLMFDVRTINWSLAYFPTDWTHYRVIYSAKARLIDLKSKKVLGEGFCARVPDKVDTAPTYEELLASDAARLKQEILDAAQYCSQKFKTDIFKL